MPRKFASVPIKFSLLGETILEWNDKDIEHYHARRMAMDSMLCRFKATYPAERIDSVRSLLEDKERILRALKQANGNRSVAAELLGIGRTTLYSKLEEYGLKYKFKQS